MSSFTVDGTVLLEVPGGNLPTDSAFAGARVSSVEIGKYPVLVEEWEWVRAWGLAHGYELDAATSTPNRTSVAQVSWGDTLKWCNAKSERAGLPSPYRLNGAVYRRGDFGPDGASSIDWDKSANGYRLPTEAEWEWAAREGAINCHRYAEKEYETKPDAAGISNMSGDFFDWCWDCEESGPERRIRGGSWKHHVGFETFGYRCSRLPNIHDHVTGIRLAGNIAVPAKVA
jgi:formylglycine-generating enzyme required for sulfatase activity